jgi:DNA polymerase I-like protein with 3'-5' exonuclease and polymerase domains
MPEAETSGLADVQLHLVDSVEKASEFIRWLGERRPHNAIGLDIETGELPGNPKQDALSPWHGDIRLVQIGDGMQGWAVPWETWSGVFYEAMDKFDGPIVCHNIAFEARWFDVKSKWSIPWHRAHDTMIMAHLIDPLGSGALKRLASLYVDPKSANLQGTLDSSLSENGWTWGTVPVNFAPYWTYGALDPVITIRLWEKFYNQCGPGQQYEKAYELEMAVRKIVTRMEVNGARVDLDYSKKKYEELISYTEDVKNWAAKKYDGVSITSNVQLVRLVERLGGVITEVTPSGQKSASKDQIQKLLIDSNPEVRELANTVLQQRKADKLATTYFLNFMEKHVDGLLHPSVRTLGARTGRMCIPTDHMLLTPSGPKKIDDVAIGDLTLDMYGNWVRVEKIHRYSDEEVLRWDDRLISTENHRWVWQYEGRNKRHVESTAAGRRHTIILAPEPAEGIFDFSDTSLRADTDGEKFAALVGMLITDGRCVDEGAGIGLRSTVYQTEKKFYQTLIQNIPSDAIMYDLRRSTTNGNAVHEIRIKARWLRPRLDAAGIRVSKNLKDSPDLIFWVSRLPMNELRAFFSAAFLCDGSTAIRNHKIISSQNKNTRDAFRVAGYRLGYISTEKSTSPSEWSSGDCYFIRFKKAVKNLRNVVETRERSDVWCVTTETGTFTAWSEGPYLTGNSITDPALQTLPAGDATVRRAFIPKDEDHVIISSDLDQVEFRLTAAMSSDQQLIGLFHQADATGGDAFTEIMRDIYQDPTLQKSDSRRKLVKGVVYGKLYGAGVTKMAITAGVPEEQMRPVVDAFDRSYPGVKDLQKQIEDVGMRRLKLEGQGYVRTQTGRRLPCDDDRVYSLTNYLVQSSAAEIFKMNLVKMDMADLTEYMIVPVHDEIVLQAPRKDVEEIMQTVKQCMTTTEGWAVPLTAGVDGPFENWGEKYQ